MAGAGKKGNFVPVTIFKSSRIFYIKFKKVKLLVAMCFDFFFNLNYSFKLRLFISQDGYNLHLVLETYAFLTH